MATRYRLTAPVLSTWFATTYWSATSGGAGGASVPTSSDDVVFDDNSGDGFRTLISGGTAECKSLTSAKTTGQAQISITASGGGHLNIYGDLSLNAHCALLGDNIAAQTEVSLLGTGAQSFAAPATSLVNVTLVFAGTGTYTLTGNVAGATDGAAFIFDSGTFDADAFDIFGAFILRADIDEAAVIVKMGSGTWNVVRGVYSNDGRFQVNSPDGGATITIDHGTASLVFSGLLGTTTSMALVNNSIGDLTFDSMTVEGDGQNDAFEFDYTSSSVKNVIVTNAFIVDLPPITIKGTPNTSLSTGSIDANGFFNRSITLNTITGDPVDGQWGWDTDVFSGSYIKVGNNIASGDAIPFNDRVGGMNLGNTTNWLLPAFVSQRFQNTFLAFADGDGDVQQLNAGNTDNGADIFYQLETQEIDFSNRAHWKQIANQIAVFTRDADSSTLSCRQDGADPKPIEIDLSASVAIGDNVNLKGRHFVFRWSGSTNTVQPVFEGIYLEDINDFGLTSG